MITQIKQLYKMSSSALQYLIYKRTKTFRAESQSIPCSISQDPLGWEWMGLGQRNISNPLSIDKDSTFCRKALQCTMIKAQYFSSLKKKTTLSLSSLLINCHLKSLLTSDDYKGQLPDVLYWATFLCFKSWSWWGERYFIFLTNREFT